VYEDTCAYLSSYPWYLVTSVPDHEPYTNKCLRRLTGWAFSEERKGTCV
jgi:hypothetical protein